MLKRKISMQSFNDLLQDTSKSTSYNPTIHAPSPASETLVDPKTGELLHSYPEKAGDNQDHQPFAFDEPKTPFNQQDMSFAQVKTNSFRLPQSHEANFFRWFHFLYPLICAVMCSAILYFLFLKNTESQNQKMIEFGHSVESSLSNLSSVHEDLQTLMYRVEQLDEDLQSIENLTLENERLFSKAQSKVALRPQIKQATIVDPLKDFIYLGNFSMNQITHVVLATPSGKKYFKLGDMPIPLLRIHQIQDDLIILIDAVGKPHILLRERSSQ
ncbi:MAG: hypothetical protein HQ456_06300 [Polynucleobacter sp.]|jgi:hypothetical protein|nr:hypothetical protein [Polynucleobacter sp.]